MATCTERGLCRYLGRVGEVRIVCYSASSIGCVRSCGKRCSRFFGGLGTCRGRGLEGTLPVRLCRGYCPRSVCNGDRLVKILSARGNCRRFGAFNTGGCTIMRNKGVGVAISKLGGVGNTRGLGALSSFGLKRV